jgi:hypothetical protein
MSIGELIAASATAEVEVGGATWRVRRPTSMDLLRAGTAMLTLIPSIVEGERGSIEALAEEIEKVDPAKAMSNPSIEAAIETLQSNVNSLVCASLVAAKAPGGEWEDVEAVMLRQMADPPKNRVWVEDLPKAVKEALVASIMSLADENGRWARALHTFRVEPGPGSVG